MEMMEMNCVKCGKPIRNLPEYVAQYTTVVCNTCAVTKATKEDIRAARERALPKSKIASVQQDEELPVAA